MTKDEIFEYLEFSKQLELKKNQKELDWLKTRFQPCEKIKQINNNHNSKDIKDTQTATITGIEKDQKQLKIHFSLDGIGERIQCYQFTPEGVYYLKNNFLEPMGILLFDNNSTPKEIANFNYDQFCNFRVETKWTKQKGNNQYWNLNNCIRDYSAW